MIDLTHHPFTISCMGTRERNTPGGEVRNVLSLFRQRSDVPDTSRKVSLKRPRSESSDELVYYGPENREFMTISRKTGDIKVPMSGIPRYVPRSHRSSAPPIYKRAGYATTIEDLMFDINSFLVTDKDGCRIWTGPMSGDSPVVKHKFFAHIKEVVLRRFLYVSYGLTIDSTNSIKTSCEKKLCCHIPHMISVPRIVPRELTDMWAKIEKRSTKNKQGCMKLKGVCKGPGSSIYNGKNYRNHLISYMANKGEIPKDLICRHMCTSFSNNGRNLCIAPDHLELGTMADNNRDKIRDGTSGIIPMETARLVKLSKFPYKETGYETQEARARRYGTSARTISRIDEGELYPELPDRHGKTHPIREIKTITEDELVTRKVERARVWTIADYDYLRIIINNQKRTYTTDKNRSKGVVKGSCWEHCCKGDSYARKKVLNVSRQLHTWACMSMCRRVCPDGEITRHLCGNPKCFNPEHLKFGTNAENSIDSILHDGFKGVTWEKVVEIRAHGKICTHEELGEKYNVSGTTISNVLLRKSWDVTLDHLLL